MLKLRRAILALLSLLILLTAGYYLAPLENDNQESAQNETARAPSANPIEDSVELFVGEVYETGVDLAQVPYELLKTVIIEAKIDDFIEGLPVDKSVKKRIHDRVRRDDFVDEVVPFLMTLKDQYVAPKGSEPLRFENFIREKYKGKPLPPGFFHSMFEREPKKTTDGGGFQFDDNVTAHLVEIYDLIFIQSGKSPLKEDLEISERLVSQVSVRVKGLIDHFLKQMDPTSEIAEGLRGISASPDRLETLSISLIQAINWMAKKNYRMYAQQAYRARDLKKWFFAELEKPGAGRLFDYMRYSLNDRRYAFHVVVDGLQGQLTESLGLLRSNDPFIKQIAQENDPRKFRRPNGREVREPGQQQWDFLKHISTQSYKDPQYLPFFRNLYTKHPQGIAETGISTTPTISVRNLPIAKTGVDVAGPTGGTGIPNFHFVDRKTDRAYYFFGNDALQLEKLTAQAGMHTMFERLRGFVTLNCNAQYDNFAIQSYDGFLNLGLGERMRDFGDLLCYTELRRRLGVERELRELRREILDYERKFRENNRSPARWVYRNRMQQILKEMASLEDKGLPQYVLYYNPWPDHFAHFKGPFSDEIISPSGELNRLDYWLTKMQSVYTDAAVWDRTLFVMAGDHGLTPIYYIVNPEIEIFEDLKARGIEMSILKISSDEGEGPKMTNPLKPPSNKNIDVVVASTAGGNYMLDFFKNQTTGWATQPLYSDLVKLRTLAGRNVNIIEQALMSLNDTLDYLVVREAHSDYASATIRIIGPRGGGRHDTILKRQGDRILLEGSATLLGLDEFSKYEHPANRDIYTRLYDKCVNDRKKDFTSEWCTEGEWRELSRYTEKPDVVVQLAHIYDSDRAGTMNLFPRQGYGYNSKVPGRHAGEHFHEKDAFVGFWGGALDLKTRIPSCVNGSIAVHAYEHLTGKPTAVGKDAWGFPRCY